MKIGIITFSSAHNYGALLQAWALKTYLGSLDGVQAEVINYRPDAIDDEYDIYKVKRTPYRDLPPLRKVRRRLGVRRKQAWRIQKRKAFERFIAKQVVSTPPYKTVEDLQAAKLDYDVLIAGSDQIWNTKLTKGFDTAFYLDFGRPDALRLAYAASLGSDDINRKYERDYIENLERYDLISVREPSMVEIFDELTLKRMDVTCDPTLLITRKDFDELKKPSKYLGQRYIYAHQIAREDAVVDFADKLSDELGLPVLHNRPQGAYQNELDYLYRESPEELISMLENAELIISNSFHITVLAIIYHKPFITVPHITRPERMRNLLTTLGIERNLIEDVRIMPPLDTLGIDYGPVEEKLALLREDSRAWLDAALRNKR